MGWSRLRIALAALVLALSAGCADDPPAASAKPVAGTRAAARPQRLRAARPRVVEPLPSADELLARERPGGPAAERVPPEGAKSGAHLLRLVRETSDPRQFANLADEVSRNRAYVPSAVRAEVLEQLEKSDGGPEAVALVRFGSPSAPELRERWLRAMKQTIERTRDDAVLSSIAISIGPGSRDHRALLDALLKRAETMPTGEDRRTIFECEFVFAVADGRRWEHCRTVWDREATSSARDEVAAAAAIVLSESPRRHPTEQEAAALRPSLTHVFAASRDQDIQQTFVRAAAMELGVHLDAPFLRGLEKSAVNETIRAALAQLADSVETGKGCDLDAFDDAVTPGWRDGPR